MSAFVDTRTEADKLRCKLKALVEAVELMRDATTYDKHRHVHPVTDNLWKMVCKQVKEAKKEMS